MDKASRFLSRRKLLLVMGGVAGAAGAAMMSPFRNVFLRNTRELVRRQPVLRRMLLSLANAGYEEWMAQVGAIFSIGGGTSMRLAGVEAFAAGGTRPISLARDRAFMAVFDLVNGATMAGDLIYTANHPQYGPFQIFLAASSDPRTPSRMIAVFN